MDRLLGAGRVTCPAADTFGVVGRLDRVNAHGTCVGTCRAALTAVTFAVVNAVLVERNRIHERIDSSKRADITAERTVQEYRHNEERDHYAHLEQRQISRNARKALVHAHKRYAAYKHSGGAYILAEPRIRLYYERKEYDHDYQERILGISQILVKSEEEPDGTGMLRSIYAAFITGKLELLDGYLVKQILYPSEGTEQTADKSSAQCAYDHYYSYYIERYPILGILHDRTCIRIEPCLFRVGVIKYRLQRAYGTCAPCAGAGIAVHSRYTDILYLALIDGSLEPAYHEAVGQYKETGLHDKLGSLPHLVSEGVYFEPSLYKEGYEHSYRGGDKHEACYNSGKHGRIGERTLLKTEEINDKILHSCSHLSQSDTFHTYGDCLLENRRCLPLGRSIHYESGSDKEEQYGYQISSEFCFGLHINLPLSEQLVDLCAPLIIVVASLYNLHQLAAGIYEECCGQSGRIEVGILKCLLHAVIVAKYGERKADA